MDLILFGIQGSGKGTQGKILAEKHGLKIFEMGGELRSIIASGTELGNRIKATVEAGELVSDDVIMEVVENFLSKQSQSQNLLFDGIPRTVAQMQALLTLLDAHQRQAVGIYIKISEEEAIHRLTQRRICKECKTIHPGFYTGKGCKECGGELQMREDDSNLDSIQKRLDNFKKETLPVIQYFIAENRLLEVDGMQDISAVTDRMLEKVSTLLP